MEGIFETPGVVVVKIGSSTLVDGQGAPDVAFISDLCDQVATLMGEGFHPVVVSSGAVAAGMGRLGLDARPCDIPTLQACASAGQAALTETYAAILAKHGIPCGQVLLTPRDLTDREGYLNARNTLGRLLSLGAVPVVNENDTVSVAEFTFGDNDMLGAIVASIVGADLYVILSDVDGLYTANPQVDPEAKLIERVESISSDIESMAGGAGSSIGTGGMASKLRAARAMLVAGIPTVICRGRGETTFLKAARGEAIGTRFEACPGATHESARKLWIGLAEIAHGSITLDEGATDAVVHKGASILPVGVTSCTGDFAAGDVVNVFDQRGELIGRGVSRYSEDELSRIRGLKLDVIARFLPDRSGQPAVHRDELLVF